MVRIMMKGLARSAPRRTYNDVLAKTVVCVGDCA